MKKLLRSIHLWFSIPFGLIISIICLTGAILVFEDEVMKVCRHDLFYVDRVEQTTIPIDQLVEIVGRTLPDSVAVTSITISSKPEHTYQVNLSKPRRTSVLVDPYTGEVKGRNERTPFFIFMFKAHRWLLDGVKPGESMSTGKLIVGVSTILFVVILISGIIVWTPRTYRALKNGLKIKFNKGWRRFWYDLHVSGGIYASILLLIMSLTGLTWSFPWYRTAFYKTFGVEVQQKSSHGQEKEAKSDTRRQSSTTNYAQWQTVYNQLKDQTPDYRQITLSDGSASLSFDDLGNQRAADRYTFDASNGIITDATLYEHQDKTAKIRGWIYSAHVGNWGGLPIRILTFLAALLGGILPLTGYYLWIKKLISKRRRKHAAYATSQ